jgi:hypothetical protein
MLPSKTASPVPELAAASKDAAGIMGELPAAVTQRDEQAEEQPKEQPEEEAVAVTPAVAPATPWNKMSHSERMDLVLRSPEYDAIHEKAPVNYKLQISTKKAVAMKDSAQNAEWCDLVLCWLPRQDHLQRISANTVSSWRVSQVFAGYALFTNSKLQSVSSC